MDVDDDDVEENVRRPREVLIRFDPLIEFNDIKFRSHFRFTKQGFQHLLEMFENDLVPNSEKNNAISPANKVRSCCIENNLLSILVKIVV